MSNQEIEIDESLYSRQIYALGLDAMKRMANASVLISGMGGLGVEIAKNVILAGTKNVTIHDNENTTMADLGAQFYLDESKIGQNRAIASLSNLTSLNEYVSVTASSSELADTFLKQFHCIVITTPRKQSEINRIAEFCHQNGIKFILTCVRGVFGFVFNDFGDDFVVSEPSTEKPTRFMIEYVSQDEKGEVTIADKEKHNLQDGDHVTFDQIEGMTELNGREFAVKVKDYKHFYIGDTSQFHPYTAERSNGYGNQKFMPITMHFKSLASALSSPEFTIFDFNAFSRDQQVGIAFFALSMCLESGLELTYENLIASALQFNNQYNWAGSVDDSLIKEFARENAVIVATSAVFGGIVGQEVIKSISGKFIPINNFLAMGYIESLPSQPIVFTIHNDRYDPYRIVFGDVQFEALQKLRYFMIGAGAIGCEMLKNWAMMGVATHSDGMIYLTDMDSIEKSNLNRQFLFRNSDIGKKKSETAANAVKVMNPQLQITAQNTMVGEQTEDFYNDDFYSSLDGICNALDNAQTRLYADSKCVFFNKPLLESGTLGPIAHFQMIIPRKTLSYASYSDPQIAGIPQCTLHFYPTNINHCTMWARDVFGGLFTTDPTVCNQYLSHPGYVKHYLKSDPGSLLKNLKIVDKYLILEKSTTYDDCIAWARHTFDYYFNYQIRDLLYTHPPDEMADGKPFWSGTHRQPDIIEYDPTNEMHAQFIKAAAYLRALVYGITPELGNEAQKAASVEPIPYKPCRIEEDDKEGGEEKKPVKYGNKEKQEIKVLAKKASPIRLTEKQLNPVEFDKDDSINFHMDFVAAVANLRATNYRIPAASQLEIKGIAGNIIPALATTTAMICGFVSLELYKMHSVVPKDINEFRDGFINLGTSSYTLSVPNPCQNTVLPNGLHFNLWDKWILEGDLTLDEAIQMLESKYNIKVTALTVGQIMVFCDFMPTPEEYKTTKVRELYINVAKLKIPENKSVFSITVECVDPTTDKTLDIPDVYIKFQ